MVVSHILIIYIAMNNCPNWKKKCFTQRNSITRCKQQIKNHCYVYYSFHVFI